MEKMAEELLQHFYPYITKLIHNDIVQGKRWKIKPEYSSSYQNNEEKSRFVAQNAKYFCHK